jgi:F0F1-type ATP synthase membrane subunit b/b'
MIFTLDGTFWAQLINFGIFFAILNVVFLRPVGEAIRKRREYIESVKGDYDRYRHQIEGLTREADEKRAVARREAAEAVQQSRAKAENEAGAVAAQFADRAAKLVDEAHRQVGGELTDARAREPQLVKDLAQQLLERAVGAKP